MILEELNKIIDIGALGFILAIIAFVLVFTVFRRDIEKLQKLKK